MIALRAYTGDLEPSEAGGLSATVSASSFGSGSPCADACRGPVGGGVLLIDETPWSRTRSPLRQVAFGGAGVGSQRPDQAVGGELLGDVGGPAREPGDDEDGREDGVSKPIRW
jgi:hypothetical protein